MSKPRKENRSGALILIAVLGLTVVLLGTYVAGYFWLGECYPIAMPASVERTGPDYERRRSYPFELQAIAYWPCATVETWLRGVAVEAVSK